MPVKQVKFSEFLKTSFIDNGGLPLPNEVSAYLRAEVQPKLVPQGWKREGEENRPIYTNMGEMVAKGYNGIFFDDYGMYLVVPKSQIISDSIRQITGNSDKSQSDNVEAYIMYKSTDGELEIRYQIRQAGIKSFPPNYYYINVFDAAAGIQLPSVQSATVSEDYSLVCQAVSCRGFYIDGISPQISQKWPFIKEDYETICKENDPLSLMGNYQVALVNEAETIGVVNVFCNMAVDGKKRYAGMNRGAMVSALFNLCQEAPEFKIVIPYRMGCVSADEWDDVSRMLCCRLRGLNVVMVIPDEARRRDEERRKKLVEQQKIGAIAQQDKPLGENLMVRRDKPQKQQIRPVSNSTAQAQIPAGQKMPAQNIGNTPKMDENFKKGSRERQIKAITSRVSSMDSEMVEAVYKLVMLRKADILDLLEYHDTIEQAGQRS